VADDGSRLVMIDMKEIACFAAKTWREEERVNGSMEAGPVAVLRAIEVLVEERHWNAAAHLVFLSIIHSSRDKLAVQQATQMLASFDRCQQYIAAYLRERVIGPESN
jgi:hypothetical protein